MQLFLWDGPPIFDWQLTVHSCSFNVTMSVNHSTERTYPAIQFNHPRLLRLACVLSQVPSHFCTLIRLLLYCRGGSPCPCPELKPLLMFLSCPLPVLQQVRCYQISAGFFYLSTYQSVPVNQSSYFCLCRIFRYFVSGWGCFVVCFFPQVKKIYFWHI